MNSLIESFVIMQSLILGINLELKRFYNVNNDHLIIYKNKTLCVFETYDPKKHEKFNKKYNMSLNGIHYDCRFKFHDNVYDNIYYFKGLQEVKNFLDILNIKDLVVNMFA